MDTHKKEGCILKTVELHSTNGVVHIHSIGYDAGDEMYLEWDARSLIEDIPNLYRMAKQALELEDKYEDEKWRMFKKQIAKDLKKKKPKVKYI